jgi:hypothetical protein
VGISLLIPVASSFTQTSTIIVTSSSDPGDFGGAQQIGDLPGPAGLITLREAITAANNTAGTQTIASNIPITDPGFNGDSFYIFVEHDPPLTISDDATTIDGTTQIACQAFMRLTKATLGDDFVTLAAKTVGHY